MTDAEYRDLKELYMTTLRELPITEIAEHEVIYRGQVVSDCIIVPARIISDRVFHHNICDQTDKGLEIVDELKEHHTSIVYRDDTEMYQIIRARGWDKFKGRKWILVRLYKHLSIEDMMNTLSKKLNKPVDRFLDQYSISEFNANQFYNTNITNDDNGLVTVVMSGHKDKYSDIESVTIEFYGDKHRVTVKHKETENVA